MTNGQENKTELKKMLEKVKLKGADIIIITQKAEIYHAGLKDIDEHCVILERRSEEEPYPLIKRLNIHEEVSEYETSLIILPIIEIKCIYFDKSGMSHDNPPLKSESEEFCKLLEEKLPEHSAFRIFFHDIALKMSEVNSADRNHITMTGEIFRRDMEGEKVFIPEAEVLFPIAEFKKAIAIDKRRR